MLLAVSHLWRGTRYAKDMSQISEKDTDHLSVDIRRAYAALVAEWLGYMQRLKKRVSISLFAGCAHEPF